MRQERSLVAGIKVHPATGFRLLEISTMKYSEGREYQQVKPVQKSRRAEELKKKTKRFCHRGHRVRRERIFNRDEQDRHDNRK